MGRAPCCEKVGLKKGRWTAEEDEKLSTYIAAHGEGSWRSLPQNAGLLRCGKSCRLRWINYLRPDLKRGNITAEEEDTIIKLHASLGNRWSVIAGHLPGRTDNEIKNYWNSHLSRKIHCQGGGDIVPAVIDLGKATKRRQGGRPGWLAKEIKHKQQQKQQQEQESDNGSAQSEHGSSMVIDSDPHNQQPSTSVSIGPPGGGAPDGGGGAMSPTSEGRGGTNSNGLNEGGGGVVTTLNEEVENIDIDNKWGVDWDLAGLKRKIWEDGGCGVGEMLWPLGWESESGYQLEGSLDSWLSNVL